MIKPLPESRIRKTHVNRDAQPRKHKRKRKKKLNMKKALSWIKRTIAGETKVGEGIHGVLDIFPIPNQVIAKAAGYFTKGDIREGKKELKKLYSVRNGIALVAFTLFVTGVITLDELRSLLVALGEFFAG